MVRVPRERFVPGNMRPLAFRNGPLPLGHGQTGLGSPLPTGASRTGTDYEAEPALQFLILYA